MSGTATAAFLFCDLVGSTALLTRLGDDVNDDVRHECYAVFREALAGHGGSEIKSTGDGIFAVFSTSVGEAVGCGISMQRGIMRLNRAHPLLDLALRVGIAAGEAKVENGDWYGTPVVEARRLCEAAHAGQILVADVVRTLVGTRGGHSFRPVPPLELKGLARPVAACEVRWSPLPVHGGKTELFVLGSLEASRDGRPLALGGRRQRTVLACLLVHADEVVSTDRLIEEVWSDAPPPCALTTLRSYISKLRTILGTGNTLAIVSQPGSYGIRLGADQLDARRFERLASDGRQALGRGEAQAAANTLAAALALWRGAPYAEVADRPFAEAEVNRMEELRLATLEDRVEADLARGRHEPLVTELEALVAHHPLRERLWRQLILALQRAGREADALATYQRARKALAEERTGGDRGASLRRLERALPAHRRPPGPPAQPASRGAPVGQSEFEVPLSPVVTATRRGVFVGREVEHERLAATWNEAKAGCRQVLFVAGEPGIGKTRLVAELAAVAHAEGAVVLWGRCDEGLGVAYQPVVEALRHYIKHCPDETLDAQLGRGRAQLARLVPELAEDRPAPPTPAIDAETERLRLFDAVSDLLGSVARSRPLLLVQDDLHWAETPTLLLLRHLARPCGDRVLIVGTYRDTDLDPGDRLVEVLADLRREPTVARLTLEGLDEGAVAAFVDAAVGQPSRDDVALELASALRAETEGNPFFAGQLLGHLIESGGLDHTDRPLPASVTRDHVRVPEGVRDVIGHRVARLPEATRRALAVASVIGRDFTMAVLERIPEAGADADALLGALERAARARLVQEVPGRPGRFGFVHDLVRQTLYGGLSAPRRARLHRDIGEALSTQHGAPAEPVVLAHHFVAGATIGCRTEAITWSERAGARALEQFAYEDAITHFQCAIQLLEWDDPPDRAARGRLLLAEARARGAIGDVSGGEDAAARAGEDARAVDSADLLADAAITRAWWVRAGAVDPLTAQLLQDALAMVDEHDPGRRAALLSMLAFHRTVTESQGVAAESAAREAIALARGAGDPEVLADVLGLRSWVRVLEGSPNIAEQEALLAELATLPEGALNWRFGRHAWVDRMKGVVRLQAGDLASFDAHLDALDRWGEKLHDRPLLATAAMWRGLRALLEGRFDDAEEHAADMRTRAGDDTNFATSYGVMVSYLRRDQGRLEQLKPLVVAAVQQTPGMDALRSLLALVHTELDERAEATALLDDIMRVGVAGDPRGLAWSATLAHLAEVCAGLGSRQHVKELSAALAPYTRQLIVVAWGIACLGAADRYLGMLAATSGRLAEAQRYFESALALEQSVSAAPHVARTRVAYARALLASGDTDDTHRAADLLSSATDTARRLGMAGLTRDIATLTSGTSRRPDGSVNEGLEGS